MRPYCAQHGRIQRASSGSALAVDHHALVRDDGTQDPALVAIGHTEVVERGGDLFAHLVELCRREAQMLVRRLHILASVVEGIARDLADPEGAHELEAGQIPRLIPFHAASRWVVVVRWRPGMHAGAHPAARADVAMTTTQ